jgi:hypothetical protein
MVIITHIRMSPGGTSDEHITELRWWNPASGEMNSSTRQAVIDWIQTKGGVARVTDGFTFADVTVVAGPLPYLRTMRDGIFTDNLLALPKF